MKYVDNLVQKMAFSSGQREMNEKSERKCKLSIKNRNKKALKNTYQQVDILITNQGIIYPVSQGKMLLCKMVNLLYSSKMYSSFLQRNSSILLGSLQNCYAKFEH